MGTVDLENESCKQGADDHKGGRKQHASFARELVGGVSQNHNPDHGAYK